MAAEDLSAPKWDWGCTYSDKCITDMSGLMCIQIHLQSCEILIKTGSGGEELLMAGLPLKLIGPKQINPNIILVVVRHSMKRLLIYPWNKTLLYICLSEWSNPLSWLNAKNITLTTKTPCPFLDGMLSIVEEADRTADCRWTTFRDMKHPFKCTEYLLLA